MSGCWISKAVIAAVALAAAMGGVAASGQELTREDLQTAFAEPVALAVKVDKAPVLDGKMDDEAWGAGDWLEFSWADPTVPGYPTSWTKVKTVCDAEALYVLFHCRQIGDMKTVGTGEYSDKVPEDDHVSILLAASPNRWHTRKGGSPWLLIKINPNGAKWLRMYSGSEEDCDGRPLEKLEGLEAKVGRYEGYWVVETKIPFASLFEDVAKMPAFWRANFFRMRTDKRYANIRPGYHGYSHWYTAWRQSGCIPYFQPHPSLFGRLFVPVGTDVPENIRAIKPGAGAEAAARRREAEASARAATLPGLPVRAGELEPLLGGCVAGVRHVPKGPEIRGDLKDPLWKSAAPAVLRYLDLQMPSTEVEKNRTFVYLLADDECLYIGVDCEE
ncbi:MAG: hypothetical protein N3A38_10145, partial [Planctomycetota bacterium]|nr:hypothetical protein [Planctomycetota bacterium]